jgi:hypothetical protein
MSCNDLTEQIRIELDESQRLVDYTLSKRSCGRSVGDERPLLSYLRGLSATDLMHMDADQLSAPSQTGTPNRGFLNFKHLFAIRAALEVWSGIAPGGPGAPCALIGVDYSGDRTVVEAQLDVDLVTANIIACGNCHGG